MVKVRAGIHREWNNYLLSWYSRKLNAAGRGLPFEAQNTFRAHGKNGRFGKPVFKWGPIEFPERIGLR